MEYSESGRKIHHKYTIEEKNKIVLLYLDKHMSALQIAREYDLSHPDVVWKWAKQYQEYGTCVDNRGGKGKKKEFKCKAGRPRKEPNVKLEDLSKEELIKKLRIYEDIKKSLAYRAQQKQKKNIK